jgi:hypothetical protein
LAGMARWMNPRRPRCASSSNRIKQQVGRRPWPVAMKQRSRRALQSGVSAASLAGGGSARVHATSSRHALQWKVTPRHRATHVSEWISPGTVRSNSTTWRSRISMSAGGQPIRPAVSD